MHIDHETSPALMSVGEISSEHKASGGRGHYPTLKLLRGIVFSALLIPDFCQAQTLKPEDIYQKVLPSVMTLHVENAQGETYIGTAFLAVDKNVAVTAWHVISDAVKVSAKFSNDRVVKVDGLIDKDEKHDLALIRLDGAEGPEAPLCVAKPAIGSRAYVIGAPKGFEFSITDGLFSQIQNIQGSDQYQVSCPISGGNSGGPVVNERGEVVGIAAWTQRDAQNLSFAIPSTWISQMNPKLAPIGWNHVGNETVQIPASPGSLKTREPHGSVAELKQMLNDAAGQRVSITITRGDKEKKFDVVLPKGFVKH